MKKCLLIGLTVFSFFLLIPPELTKADLMPPTIKGVEACIEIENYQDYDEYRFFLVGNLDDRLVEIKSDDCASHYKLANWSLIAVRSDDYLYQDILVYPETLEEDGIEFYQSDPFDFETYEEFFFIDPRDSRIVNLRVNLGEEAKTINYEVISDERTYDFVELRNTTFYLMGAAFVLLLMWTGVYLGFKYVLKPVNK